METSGKFCMDSCHVAPRSQYVIASTRWLVPFWALFLPDAAPSVMFYLRFNLRCQFSLPQTQWRISFRMFCISLLTNCLHVLF